MNLKDSFLTMGWSNHFHYKTYTFAFQIQKKARYVRFKIVTFDAIPEGMPGEGHIQWTFLDEIMLFSK